MTSIAQQPANPEDIARAAGRDIYGSPVGGFRRSELARICNAWRVPVAVGASKDEMLAALHPLVAQGVNLLKPPTAFPRLAAYEGKSRAEVVTEAERALAAKQEADLKQAMAQAAAPVGLRDKLLGMQVGKLRKIIKDLGLPQRSTDTRVELAGKIIEFKAAEAEAMLK